MVYVQAEDGQALTEYALIIMLIAIVVIVALTFLGPLIENLYTEIGEAFP
ncbi:MAG: pilus assembly protein [Anaerolineae bacterium]|nr:pilus assembly protein [Anaerolineae bacterium]